MDIREATPADREAIAEVAERSMEASYSLSPATIRSAVNEWYGPEEFEAKVEDDDHVVLVVEQEGELIAFSESAVIETGGQGDIYWLHVHPDYRGHDVGTTLFEATREWLMEAGASYLRGRVLADNRTGTAFYEKFGFEKADEEEVEIDGSGYVEYVYLDTVTEQLRSVVDDSAGVVYVDMTDEEVGSHAPFHVVYDDPDRTDHYGYYCSNCDELANAMDSMGRIVCDSCGNTRKPTRWDSAYM